MKKRGFHYFQKKEREKKREVTRRSMGTSFQRNFNTTIIRRSSKKNEKMKIKKKLVNIKENKCYHASQGLRNMNPGNITSEDEVIELAKQDANNYTGSKSCDISLLQKFHVTMKSVKNYAAITSIPFSTPTNESVEDICVSVSKKK